MSTLQAEVYTRGGSSTHQLLTSNTPSELPSMLPTRLSRTCGLEQVHHFSGKVTGLSRGSGLSIVMSVRAV